MVVNMMPLLSLILVVFCKVDGQEAAAAFVSTSEDVSLLPGSTTTLVCVGSETDLSFYIKNRVKWSVEFSNGTMRPLTEGFYADGASTDLFEGDMAKYDITYKTETDGYAFSLKIKDIQPSDDGQYVCTLLNDAKEVISKNVTIVTVLNPIQTLHLEIHTMDHMTKYMSMYTYQDSMMEGTTVAMVTNVSAATMSPVTNLKPGQYMVTCEADGSNPAAVVSLYHNGNQLPATVDDAGSRSVTEGKVSFKSKVSMMDIPFKSLGVEQLIGCEATVPGTDFTNASAMFVFMVELEKPDFVCTNLSAAVGNRYQDFVCTLSVTEGTELLTCDKVTWTLGDDGHMMMSEERYKDPTEQFDIMETKCEKTPEGLKTSMDFYLLKPVHLETIFYVNYEMGKDSIRHPVQIQECKKCSACFGAVPNMIMVVIALVVSQYL